MYVYTNVRHYLEILLLQFITTIYKYIYYRLGSFISTVHSNIAGPHQHISIISWAKYYQQFLISTLVPKARIHMSLDRSQ